MRPAKFSRAAYPFGYFQSSPKPFVEHTGPARKRSAGFCMQFGDVARGASLHQKLGSEPVDLLGNSLIERLADGAPTPQNSGTIGLRPPHQFDDHRLPQLKTARRLPLSWTGSAMQPPPETASIPAA